MPEGGSQLIVVNHVHDEATMRLRSTIVESFEDALLGKRSRSRSSKIQNNAIRIVTDEGEIEWMHELQPVAKKDGGTICTALFLVLNTISEAINKGVAEKQANRTGVRLVHCVVGDL